MSATTYRNRQIKVLELPSGAIGASIDGRTVREISAIFERQAIELAKRWIDNAEVRE
jgi:hypothetical protein